MKRLLYFTVCIVLALFLCSCSVFQTLKSEMISTTEAQMMLNDRQKEILEQEGLPTNYDELSLTQKIAIEAIEDIFQYLDRQYPNEEFLFSGYIEKSALESEQLIVYSQYGKVTVYRDISGDTPTYEDDFNDVKAAYVCATVVNKYLAERYDEEKYIVTAGASKFDGESFAENSVLKHCNMKAIIFVEEELGEKTFRNLSTDVSEFLRENAGNNSVAADIYLVKDSEFTIDLPERYDSGINMDIFLKQIRYYRRVNGEEKFYEEDWSEVFKSIN